MIVAAYVISFLILLGVFAPMFKTNGNKARTGVVANNNLPQPIPPGFQIYAKDLPIAGSNYRRKNKVAFAESTNQCLRLEVEPDNPKDPNAIQIIGDCDDDDYELGYLPRDVAKQIHESGLLDDIKPRLIKIYVGERDDDYVNISYQLIGPKLKKRIFDAAK